ncbi:MAG: hypothetical protein ACOYOT_07410 [Bacteroidales bacterium]
MKSRATFFFIVSLILSNTLLNAQVDFRKGYIISINNDTTNGWIDYRGDQSNSIVCRFKTSTKSEVKEYAPFEIYAYRFIDSGKFYISKQIKTSESKKKLFLEYLINGKLNLYYYRFKMVDHYLVEKDTLKPIELPPLEKMVKIDGREYIRHDYKTSSIIEILTQDCPELKDKIKNLYLEQKPLIKFAKEYHNRVCGNNGCLIYEKKQFPVTFLLEPIIGIRTANSGPELGGKFEYGLFVHNWMPRTSEKIFFKFGLVKSITSMPIYHYSETHYENQEVYRIPLMFEYLYPKGIIKPTFGYGWNLILSKEEGSILVDNFDFGLVTKINSKIQISTTLNLLSSPIYAILTNQIFTIGLPTYYFGLRIKL